MSVPATMSSPATGTHTIVVHPLKNPEIEQRWKLHLDQDNVSSRYLRGRPSGFIFLRWFKRSRSVRVGLYATVDAPQELVVIKTLRGLPDWTVDSASNKQQVMASEIEFSSVFNERGPLDPLVKRGLPLYDTVNDTRTPFVQLHAFQVHRLGSKDDKCGDEVQAGDSEDEMAESGRKKDPAENEPYRKFGASLFYKYYNGGTLHDFIDKYRIAQKPVPEGFIWHVIAQLGRAVSWLHTDHMPSRKHNIMDEQNIELSEHPTSRSNLAVNLARRNGPGWVPICHLDGHRENVWLHYPTDEEKCRDPSLEHFTDSLPQIIMGDFGLAMAADKNADDPFSQQRNPTTPHLEAARDKADIGDNVMGLMTAHLDSGQRNILYRRLSEPKCPEYIISNINRMAPLVDPNAPGQPYSLELHDCLQRFDILIRLLGTNEFYQALAAQNTSRLNKIPSHDFVFGSLIAQADCQVDKYIKGGNMQPVRWTQCDNVYMPYHYAPSESGQAEGKGDVDGTEYGHVRHDWMRVHRGLERVVERRFMEYPPGSVEISTADLTGGTADGELEEVDFPFEKHHWQPEVPQPKPVPRSRTPTAPPPPPPRPPSAPGSAGSLPDYEDTPPGSPAKPGTTAARRADSAASLPDYEDTPPGSPTKPGTIAASRAAVQLETQRPRYPSPGKQSHRIQKRHHALWFGRRSRSRRRWMSVV